MNSLLIGPGLPGGMMGSLMADLEKNLASINKWLKKNGKPDISQDELLIKLFKEVEYAWPKLGYPPLVTPFSQYVKNVSLMNVMGTIKGKRRWSMIDENTWGMLLGKSGKLLGPLGKEIMDLAQAQNREFFNGTPQDLYPDELELFAAKMDEKGWDYGKDDEELMEYAMHPQQYEDYKSGKAKENFLKDLAKRKEAKASPNTTPAVAAGAVAGAAATTFAGPVVPFQPKTLNLNINGENFKVAIGYDETETNAQAPSNNNAVAVPVESASSAYPQEDGLQEILAPLEGKFYLTKDAGEVGIKVGDKVTAGQTVAYIESMKVINSVTSEMSGEVVQIVARHGDEIEEDDVIIKLK